MASSRLRSSLREAVADRAGYCSEYCLSQERYAPQRFTVDHIVPRSAGGNDDLSNPAYSCQGCNGFKSSALSAVDGETGKTVNLFNPRQDLWSAHFAWDESRTHIIGLSATGRATMGRLQFNRAELVSLREALVSLRRHPPIP